MIFLRRFAYLLNIETFHTITKLTSETALIEIFQRYISPHISTIIIKTVTTISRAEMMSQPRRRKVMTKTAAIQMLMLVSESGMMVRYCS